MPSARVAATTDPPYGSRHAHLIGRTALGAGRTGPRLPGPGRAGPGGPNRRRRQDGPHDWAGRTNLAGQQRARMRMYLAPGTRPIVTKVPSRSRSGQVPCRPMDTVTPQNPRTPSRPVADASEPAGIIDAAVTRRGFLRGAALAGTGLVAATVAACTPGASHAWEYATSRPLPSGSPAPAASAAASAAPSPSASMNMSPTPAASAAPSSSPVANMPPGWSEHDINARQVVRRYLGKIAPA